MDLQKEREAFEKECRLLCYKGNMVMSNLGSFYNNEQTNWMWQMWLSAKAQAVPEGFGDIQSWIAVNSFSALDASIVDFPVVDANELAEFIDSLNIDVAVPEGFVLVEKTKLMQIVGSAAIIEPITRGNPLMSKYKTELDFILSTVRAMIEAQEQSHE